MRTMIFALVATLVAVSACGRKADKAMDGKGKGGRAAVEAVQSVGVVTAIDVEAHTVTLSHDAIPEIGWGAMTMEFAAEPGIDMSSIKSGDNLHFMLKPDGAGNYRLAMACRIEGDVDAHKAAMKSMMQGKDEPSMMGLADGAILRCTE